MAADDEREQHGDSETPKRKGAGGEQSGGARRKRRGAPDTDFGAMATRALARAQRAWDDAEGKATAEADFHLRQANVLATLELARAFRLGGRGGADGEA